MKKLTQWRNALIGHYEGDKWIITDEWKPIETRPRNPDGITFRSVLIVDEKEYNNLKLERDQLLNAMTSIATYDPDFNITPINALMHVQNMAFSVVDSISTKPLTP